MRRCRANVAFIEGESYVSTSGWAEQTHTARRYKLSGNLIRQFVLRQVWVDIKATSLRKRERMKCRDNQQSNETALSVNVHFLTKRPSPG